MLAATTNKKSLCLSIKRIIHNYLKMMEVVLWEGFLRLMPS
jgi:hypothetical protein